MISDKLNLTISTLNVNSLNVSTLGGKVSKIKKMFNLSRNGKYKLYYNSDKESRGVAIAIKSSIFHVVNNIYMKMMMVIY